MGYQFGSQFNLQLSAFRKWKWNDIILIPNAGLAYEQIFKDRFANGRTVVYTNGRGLFITKALQIQFKSISNIITFSIPISTSYSNGEVTANTRINYTISYNF